MADLFPDEGLDLLLAVIPKAGSAPANMFLGLYCANTGNSVPTGLTLAQLAGLGSGAFAEVSATQWAAYTRQTHVAGSWGAAAGSTVWSTVGRAVQGSQLSFAAPAAPYTPAQPLAGFFLANAITAGSAYYYSNFSDNSTIASLAIGDIVKVQPGFGFGN